MRSSSLKEYSPVEYTGRREKRSGHPPQPGYRSTTSRPAKKRKRKNILRRAARFFKRLNWKGRLLLGVIIVVVLSLLIPFVTQSGGSTAEEPETLTGETVKQEYIFRDGEGHPVNWEGLTDAWAAEAGFEKRYTLTDAERWEIASVITAEAVGEPFAGKVAVAQCILQSCEDDGIGPFEVLTKYKYSRHRPDPCEEALEAVQAVFDFGQVATTEPIKYFYAPARVVSDFHESQDYVMTINGHKFFKEATE